MTLSSRHKSRMIPIDREGWRFVVPLLGVVAICLVLGWLAIAACLLLITLAVGAFFRDPERPFSEKAGVLLSPADGKVADITTVEAFCPDGQTRRFQRVGIFLSVFNNHVQRIPEAGQVLETQYRPGKYLAAFNPKASSDNEANMLWLQGEESLIGVKQIAGLIARRIVCRARKGQSLARGQRFGLIRFGSRVELYVPENYDVIVKIGDTVKGNISILAEQVNPREPATFQTPEFGGEPS